ncbi:MAG: hypothetical protein ABIF19_18390 [Planctomycetota bacterium]
MKKNKNLLAVAATVLCGIIVVWLSTSIQGGQTTYELRPQVTVPEHRTDVTRIVDAYERLMERYMDLTESNMVAVSTDLRGVLIKLDSIDGRLTELSERTRRIEKALGIEEPQKQVERTHQPVTNDQDR